MAGRYKKEKYDSCISCGMSRLCDVADNNTTSVKLYRRTYTVERKQCLARNDDWDGFLYAVCTGSFKSITHANGDTRIIDIHYPGDILGLDHYIGAKVQYDLVANERSTIEEFILPRYQDIESVDFLKEIVTLNGNHFRRLQEKFEILGGKRSTLELVASFIYSFVQRFKDKNLMVTEFKLPLTRGEIAEYLGLASETISRQFVILETMKIIKTKGQRLTILDVPGLKNIGNIQETS